MALKTDKIWVIAYINREHIKIANEELERYEYNNVEAYIPTVRILKKQFKGQNVFEFVPLLFNYGFFKITYKDACNPTFLMELRERITCIYAWVKDPSSAMSGDLNLNFGNKAEIEAIPMAAVATDKEVSLMVKASKSMSIYSESDLGRIKVGDFIKLEGYPFEGIPAEILQINRKKGDVKVKLHMDQLVREVTVSFENVFYTIYKNFNEESREASTDDLKERYGENSIDHITFKNSLV